MSELEEIFSGNDIFYCEHISRFYEYSEKENIFFINKKSGKGLEIYLKESAINDENINENRTYIVRDKVTREIVGYFSLKMGIISTNERKTVSSKVSFDTIPAIELANFAMNDNYKQSHEGERIAYKPGKIIFVNFILPIAKEISKYIGAKALFVFALPEKKLLSYYKSLNFSRLSKESENKLHNRLRPNYDKGCIFMWQSL